MLGLRKTYQVALLVIVLMLGLAIPTLSAHAIVTSACVDPGDPLCFATIQSAVDGVAPGTTINVAAGTYAEQVVITKSLQLVGAGAGASFIQAPGSLPAASDPNSFIVKVSGAGVSAEITGFTITGPGPSACGSIASGIVVRDTANANIHDNTIADIRDNAVPLSGCQNGNGILVGRNAWATTGTATITNNTIVGYQKTGIVVDAAGSSAIITGNTITGIGTTAIIAQNGIQISRGADATLTGNTITGSSFHLDGSGWDWGSAGILLYQAGDVVLAGGNTVTGNDNALYNEGSASLTVGAETFGNSPAPVDSGYDVINLASYPLDLSNVTFLGSADNFAIADRIWDGLDDPTLGVATVEPGNLYVTPLSGSIQAAIDAAADGDTINVAAGTYAETLNIDARANLTIVGADPATTIIQPAATIGWNVSSYGESRKTVLRVVNSTGIAVSNFTFDLDLVKANNVYAGFIWDSTGSLSGNVFKNNVIPEASGGYYEGGVYVRAPGYSAVSRAAVSVTGNTFENIGRVSLLIHDFVNATVSGNSIYRTVDDFGYAIELGSLATGTINGNTIYGFDTAAASDGSNSAGIYVENAFTYMVVTPTAKNVTVSNNNIYGNQWGLYMGNEFDGYAGDVDVVATVSGNNIHDNVDGAVLVADEDKADGSSMTATFTNNTLANNGGYGYYLTTAGDGSLTVNIDGGSVSGHGVGVYLSDTAAGASGSDYSISVETAAITGNTTYGVQNTYSGTTIDASPNWWGSVMPVWASVVTGNVTYTPWCIDAGCLATTPFATTTTITDLPDPTSRGNLVTMNFSVVNNTALGPLPAGSVDVSDGTTEVCSDVALDGSGNGSCTYNFTTAGTFTLTATFTPTDGVLIAGSSGTAAHRVVNKPILLSPVNGKQLLFNRPTFDWTDLMGSRTYRIQIATDSTFTNLLTNTVTSVSKYKPSTSLPANVTLWWRVRRETGVISKWSKPFSFTTANPPSVPVLLLPANGAVITDLTPQLDWKNVIAPAGTTFDHYKIQVFTDRSSPSTSLVLEKTRLNSMFTFTADLAPGTYYWRVRSYNTDGEYSNWSIIWSFTIQP